MPLRSGRSQVELCALCIRDLMADDPWHAVYVSVIPSNTLYCLVRYMRADVCELLRGLCGGSASLSSHCFLANSSYLNCQLSNISLLVLCMHCIRGGLALRRVVCFAWCCSWRVVSGVAICQAWPCACSAQDHWLHLKDDSKSEPFAVGATNAALVI
jgi:hypothetical protein